MIIKMTIQKPGSFELTKFLNQKLIIQYYPSKKYFGETKIPLDEQTTQYLVRHMKSGHSDDYKNSENNDRDASRVLLKIRRMCI